ncbi:MAG: DNA alkylation repair protein [Candidatus Thermoplasmatota archaeon]|nr:DNA alkylation repair protein [Candidatus Thermoplasmatota archaeon]
MSDIIQSLREELQQNIDEHTRNTAQRFFKEQIKVYGIKTATVSKISRRYFSELQGLDKTEIFTVCDTLFSSGFLEESFIACNWSYYLKDRFEEKDFFVFERWLGEYINNWASCDTLCNHTVGAFLELYPAYIKNIKTWTQSDNRWLRRASAVSLIIPAKKGMFLKDAFDIADMLINDSDDLVQKGYGWLLKEQSRTNQKEVFEYVFTHKNTMPRTALRYAIEKMPKELRAKAMER